MYEDLADSAEAAADSGNCRMRGRQEPRKEKGKNTVQTPACDKLYQRAAIADRYTPVSCPASCGSVYSTKLSIDKLNATRSAIRVQRECGGVSRSFEHSAKKFQRNQKARARCAPSKFFKDFKGL